MKDFLSQAGKLLKEHKQYKRQLTVFLCLAVIVAFSTVTALKLYGQAMTHKMEVLDCQYQVHQHIEDCYAKDEQGNPGTELICGYADYAIHAHNEDCYDSKGNLVCGLEEHEKHEHTDECFTTELVLVCGLEEVIPEETPEDEAGETPEEPAGGEESTPEAAGQPEAEAPVVPEEESEPIQEEVLICQSEVHAHSEGCYETALACGQEEHVHGEGCTSQELACGTEEHAHGEGCYDEEGNLTCEVQEHAHEEACYTTANVCGAEEHTHGDECYTTNLICGIEEHEHTESCYELVTVPAPADNGTTEPTVETPAADETAGEEVAGEDSGAGAEPTESTEPAEPESEAPAESEPEGHVHTEACYEEVKTLVCEEQELHIHDNSCYGPECFDENGALIEGSRVSCGLLQLEEHTHAHTEGEDSCFKTVELTPEEVEALENGATLHIHEESCYDEEGNLICGHDATHIHVPECYDEAGELICGYGTASHVHEDKCYDENGELTCGYETASHVHEDSCYDAEGKLQCGYEAASHVHEDSCYDEEGELVCGYETATHVHEDSCYDEEGKLQCGYETASHVHEDSCYDEDGKLVCGYETASHVHEESCYDEEGNLICGYETASHVHQESCYDEEGNLVCGYEAASHPHTEDCYDEEGNLICGYETATHVHNESCYDEEGNVICGYAAEIHEHDEDCYDEEGNLICGYNKNGSALDALYCNELVHQHDEDCYDEAGNLTCGKADFAAHTHTDECYNVEGKKICPLPEREAHVHSEACYPEGAAEGESEAEPACGKDEIALHTHTEECYDTEGVLTCGETEVLEHVHSEDCKVSGQSVTKTFENESFIITAVYNRDANIPEEAELLAEQITEESNGEHYAKRQAEYQEALGDDMATMRALLKIGFYVNGQEVEPESPVTVTIQFLNEDGLAEGKPITVIHFAEDGTELLEGSKVEGGSTTFEMESFSEIAVGYGVENVRVPVDAELKYGTDEFEVTFRIEGEVNVPVDGMRPREEAGAEGEAAAPGEADEAAADEEGMESDAVADESEAGAEDADVPEGNEADGADGSNTEADVIISEDGVSVTIENSALEKKLEFRVDPLDENAEEYAKAAAAVYADGTEGADELDDQLFLQVLSYKMLYDGKKLDLSDCTVTAEVKPSEALVEYAETAVDPMTLDLDGEEQIADGVEVKPEVVITAVELGEDAAEGEIADAMVVGYEAMAAPMLLSLRNADGIMLISGTSQANPNFFVQYYAYIDTFSEGEIKLNIIDTSGKKLPKNGPGGVAEEKDIYVNKVGGTGNKIATTKELTEVYRQKEHFYITAPSLVYFNRLAENNNYELKEIWVLKDGKDSSSLDKNDWTVYSCEQEWHFTNKEETAKDEKDFILIKKDTVIRLVCDVTSNNNTNAARFFDYDVSDGKLYNSANKNDRDEAGRGDHRSPNTQKTWYMNTGKQGINSNNNLLAFGNSEGALATGLGGKTWKDPNGIENTLNQANSNGYGNCTFGLASALANGNIVYAPGVNPPNMFDENTTAVNGKTSYDGSLTFKRSGDTYTLISADVAGKSSVDKLDEFFWRQGWSVPNLWSNNFYPLDNVESAGTDGHDLMFGETSLHGKLKSFNPNENNKEITPNNSDDGQNHNHYFGMNYKVDFTLTADYIGPLEYIFYGDDDMWVFLSSDEGKTGKLICDIGGVHGSVGEYVNLWDYIEDGSSGKYSLYFFYTERGASGSCCWMQFTLPSVSFRTPEQTTGNLEVTKKVTDVVNDDLFGFEIEFTDEEGNNLRNNYSYTQYDANGEKIKNDVLIWDGGKFQLKAGERIEIIYLPVGTHYTITEIGPIEYTEETVRDADGNEVVIRTVIYDENGNYIHKETDDHYIASASGGNVTNQQIEDSNGEKQEDRRIVKGIISDTTSKYSVEYVNKYVLEFALPETGGSGTILYTMAGGMVLLFGAGFLYKKKFRERRG